MRPKQSLLFSLSTAAILVAAGLSSVSAAPYLIVGNDEKLLWDDKGAPVVHPAGKDSVVILDLANPENPKVIASLPLKNSVVGPPTNLAIDPTNSIALVADSIDVTQDGDKLKMGPDNKIYVIDLKANPPKLAGTVTVGKQPSGLSFNAAGNLALVTNRVDKSVSVLSVKGTDVKVIDTIDLGGIVSHVVFTPDGKRALVSKFNDHKVSLARHQWRQGDLQQTRFADRSVALQCRRCTERQHRAYSR
jgi:DNA-binding beta-propeller fold protein YncE